MSQNYEWDDFCKSRKKTVKRLIKDALDGGMIYNESIGEGGIVDKSVDKYLMLIESIGFDEFLGLCGAIAIVVDQKYTFTEEDHIYTDKNIKSTIVNETLYWHENVITEIVDYEAARED